MGIGERWQLVEGETSWNFVRGAHKMHQSRELETRIPPPPHSLIETNVADLVHDAIMIMRAEEI